MIVVVGGQKGGTGKSTITVNLSVWLKKQMLDPIIVDSDVNQATSSNWTHRRNENNELTPIPCVLQSGNLIELLRNLDNKYSHVIVDAGGFDSKELRSSMLVARKLITPIRPSQADLDSMLYMDNLTSETMGMNPSLQSHVVITQAPTHPGVTLIQEAKDLLVCLKHLLLCKTVIYNRKPYIDCISIGCGVIEMGSSTAADEINSIATELT